MKRSFLGPAAVVFFATVLAPLGTYGQSLPVPTPVAGGPNFSATPGIKVSDALTMHAGLGIETRYDSNVFYTSASEGTNSAVILRVLPSLSLTSLAPARDGQSAVPRPWVFLFGLNLDYREYLSSDAVVRDQRDVAVDSTLRLGYAWTKLRLGLSNVFTRTADPPNVAAPQSPQFDRDYERASVDITGIPGGGALELRFTYAYSFNIYEQEPLNTLGSFNFHQFNVNAKWKRFPKTAFFLEVDQQIWSYFHITKDSYPFRVDLGMAGLITEKFSVTLKVGYGNSFYKSGGAVMVDPTTMNTVNYSNVVASADLRYRIAPTASVYVGYEHNFSDTIFANFFSQDRAYAGYDQVFVGRLLGHVRLTYDRLSFQGLPAGTQPPDRVEHRFALEVHLDWQIKRWLYLGVGYDLWTNSAPPVTVMGPAGMPAIPLSPDFIKHNAFARISVYY